jgi:tetratricopeptide (TPR) repeat protein
MLESNTPLVIDQNSEFVVTAAPAGSGSLIDLLRGALLFITRVRRSIEIRTPFVNAAIEGTEFVVRVQADRTVITVFEGTVRASNLQGMVLVGAGQQAVAVQGQAPQVQLVVRPRDAVQWALYYEPVLPSDSFAQLAAIPEAARDAVFYVRRAGLLLGSGQLDEARADLDQALKLQPSSGDAYALRAIVAVALNDRDGALTNGQMAVQQAPRSASAQLALSYALQANLQLEAARDAVMQAVNVEPDNGAAWARLAELRLMLDDAGGAVDAARRAASLSPQVGRAQSALGYALLAQLKISEAREAFERAIDVEPDNPLARLGLGLARIRQGRLAEGRGDLELAVALNPDNALMRSYLGKAYFDEKREPLPEEQFQLAKQLDAQDPTPSFYDAIRKQTLNRPVEALRELQQSIQLNDNRAVYRSRLLLDQDQAARNASLARVYRDLGFGQLAFLEAAKSLDADSSDHSGHRFLAEAYAALPRHEVARVSEVLQAQLLQPTSLTPVPPRMAESDLFILEGAGPDRVGFNEFNPMFSRNRLGFQFSGVAGGNSVLGDEATVSGVWNQVSFSVGQFHYDTDGFRTNNQQDRDIANAFIQAQISRSTTLQAEFRAEDTRTGDLTLLFDPANFSPDAASLIESTVTRLGLRQIVSPRSQVIASFYIGNRDTSYDDSAVSPGLGLTSTFRFLSRTDSWTGEVRYLFSSSRWRATAGFGRFESDRERENATRIQLPFPPFLITNAVQFSDDADQTNGYLYASVDFSKQLTLTLGASADSFSGESFERKQFNPKAGLTWSPTPSTTFRVASFRTLHRAVVSNQTIEPTQVAGFNQLFGDTEGSDAWRYGLAWDQKLSGPLSGGAEYSWRNLKVPVQIGFPPQARIERTDREEQLGRSYVYWTPQDSLALSLEYVFEKFYRDFGSAENILMLRTHRVPIGVRYFSQQGWWVNLSGTHISQNGVFSNIAFATTGDDQFWVFDAGVGYRLPKRLGRVSLQIKNLFDEEFRFQDTDPGNPVVKPGRLALLAFTVGV